MLDNLEFYITGAISIIGIIEWIKHLKISNLEKFTPYISLILCIIASIFAAITYNKFTFWNIFVYFGVLLSCVQLGYQSIVQSICKAINNFINPVNKIPDTNTNQDNTKIDV